ncbi:hypothetical protein K402DRAFT_455917 [Aulographum hederae CBS 113979]|uniref:Transcriptional regulator n=1 Tax=Aulographum hederae CBS 113979 TaxID=1176131 RepID=A0A6G1GU32_9PEZI|nr:hypothetical protein K402DRAFT_455917 [Aulographum hederae CBS 113979]
MSDSDSDAPMGKPSDRQIEQGLRDAVKNHFATKKPAEDLTVKRLRTVAEKVLKLRTDFFKTDLEWKEKSKTIIQEEVENHDVPPSSPEVNTVPKKSMPKKVAPPPKDPKRGTKRASDTKAKPMPRKKQRVAPSEEESELSSAESFKSSDSEPEAEETASEPELASPPPKVKGKRIQRKKTAEESVEESEDFSPKQKKQKRQPAEKAAPVRKSAKPKAAKKAADEEGSEEDAPEQAAKPSASRRSASTKVIEEDSDEDNAEAASKKDEKEADTESNAEKPSSGRVEEPEAPDSEGDTPSLKPVAKKTSPTNDAADDSSSLSSLIDAPASKPARKKKSTASTKSAKSKTSKTKPTKKAPAADLSPSEQELKTLQSHLLACGIRKVWSRYLAKYSSNSEKIAHLKELLKDVGMEGRFSAEKAQKIKDERELKAEMEAIQEGEKMWGQSKGDDEASEEEIEDNGRPKRKLARGLRGLEFLGSDGEETS